MKLLSSELLMMKSTTTWWTVTAALLVCALTSTHIGCAHQPKSGAAMESARTEIGKLESSLSARRSQLPTLATAPASPESVPSMSATAAQSAPSSRCDGACLAAQAICGYSRRICELAEQIADEPSQRSCKCRARMRCRERVVCKLPIGTALTHPTGKPHTPRYVRRADPE